MSIFGLTPQGEDRVESLWERRRARRDEDKEQELFDALLDESPYPIDDNCFKAFGQQQNHGLSKC